MNGNDGTYSGSVDAEINRFHGRLLKCDFMFLTYYETKREAAELKEVKHLSKGDKADYKESRAAL